MEPDMAKRHPEERDVPEYTFGNNGESSYAVSKGPKRPVLDERKRKII